MNKLENYKEKYGKIAIQIGYKDRPTELSLLLQSLRTQSYNEYDIFICDDGSGSPLPGYYFLAYIFQRMKLEGHNIKILRNDFPTGVSKVRQALADEVMKQKYNYKLLARIDDDSICDSKMIEKLIEGIEAGYDLIGCIVPPLIGPDAVRETKFVEPIIGECRFGDNNDGKLIINQDDCGYLYTEEKIIPTHHFRSSCLYKRELHERGVDYNSRLSKNGFREEQIFSFKVILKGFKLGVHTGAICLHLMTPSGGERDTMNMGQFNQTIFEETTRKMFEEHGNFLKQYNEKLGIKEKEYTKEELTKSTNLVYNK